MKYLGITTISHDKNLYEKQKICKKVVSVQLKSQFLLLWIKSSLLSYRC